MYPRRWLNAKARETGAVKRERVVNVVVLFWVLVTGVQVHTLAGLHRLYEKTSRKPLSRGAFYKRFTPGLARFLRACVEHGVQELAKGTARELRDGLRVFKDVLIHDNTILRLHEALAKKWPATRTRKVAAGIKVGLLVSVVMGGVNRVHLAGERVHETRTLRLGSWVKDRVLLVDLGFFKYRFFARIHALGGYFVSRLKENADPLIVSVHRSWRGNSVPVAGKRLHEILARLKRGVLDVEVEVSFRRRAYRGKRHGDTQRFRLVAVRNAETGKYHVYITNISPNLLNAEEVAALYAARWHVELVFKELKSHYAWDEIRTRNPRIVEALVWAGIATLLVSRRVYGLAIERHANNAIKLARYTHLRWAIVFKENAQDLLACIVGNSDEFAELIERLLSQAVDPNVNRKRLLDRVRT